MLDRLKAGIARTRQGLAAGLQGLLGGRARIDAATLDSLEELLLTSDVGVEATTALMEGLTARRRRKALPDGEAVVAALREDMLGILEPVQGRLTLPEDGPRPFVILVVGVNGAGKTTTIAKLAKHLRDTGRSVLLAAGDTFRAAAVEQLRTWGERNAVPVVAQPLGSDAASVIYDGISAAAARGIDVVIADTAGRLHTQAGLMDELRKIDRVIKKHDPGAPHETLLILDATVGQNAVSQARQFRDAVPVSGICLTKLDGSARGGILLALAERVGLPVYFVGVGEGIDDLLPFDRTAFVDALLTPREAAGE